MKHFKFSIAWLAMLALVFTSCSKEESDPVAGDQELVEITFGSLMNNFNSQMKQADPGECSDGTPSYVLVGITEGADPNSTSYIDDGDPDADDLIEVGLKWNASMDVWETMYTDLLALPAGPYHLQHFVVYDEGGNALWVAPRTGGAYASNVDNPLPQLIDLAAGTKPYITVDVLCFIPRSEEAYGYLFFDLNQVRIENNYCIFVDYCWDETGRDYPAAFSVEVWTDDFEGTPLVLNNSSNVVNTDGAWPSASVLCFALPEIAEDELYYVRVSIEDYPGAYELDEDGIYRVDFTISQADIDAQLEMTPRYEHIRFNCQPGSDDPCIPGSSNKPGDWNNDCVVDCKDTNTCPDDPTCPNGPVPGDTNGDCEVTCADDDSCEEPCDVPGDTNGDCVVTCADDNSCPEARCDTAYMLGDYILMDHYPGNNWGWGLLVDGEGADVNPDLIVGEGEWLIPFYGGAGQNDLSKGWEAGNVRIVVADGDITITIEPHENVTVGDTHFWFSDNDEEDMLWPANRAPGFFDMGDGGLSFTVEDIDATGPYAIIVHAGDTCYNYDSE